MMWAAMLAMGVVPVGVAPLSQALAAPKLGATITVRVLNVKVMKAAKFIGATAGTAVRGTQLKVAEVKGDWYRVTGTVNGWVHRTSVEERAVALSARPGANSGSAASKDEIELAGRGFTPQVEGEYRKANPALDFAHVDAIETVEVVPEALAEFVNAGGLAGADPQEQAQAAYHDERAAAPTEGRVGVGPSGVARKRGSSTASTRRPRVGSASAVPASRGGVQDASHPGTSAAVLKFGGAQ